MVDIRIHNMVSSANVQKLVSKPKDLRHTHDCLVQRLSTVLSKFWANFELKIGSKICWEALLSTKQFLAALLSTKQFFA